MAMRYIILLYLLTIVKTDTSSEQLTVSENINEVSTPSPDIGVVRVARHPKLYQRQNPSTFDYKSISPQDTQNMHYAQQQEIDSYIRAYRLVQQSKRSEQTSKQSKQLPNDLLTRPLDHINSYIAPNESSISENIQTSSKQNTHIYPSDTLYEQVMKVVDPKYLVRNSGNKFSNGDKSLKATESDNLKLTAVSEEKVSKKATNVGYQVGEEFSDQETEASDKRESRLYVGQEELLKNIQYGTPLSANFLPKPMYVLANPNLQLDPKLFAQGLQYNLPENHQLRAEGFESASKTDLDALSSLLGKGATDQLQGLNQLLGQQVENLQESFPAIPKKQTLVDFNGLAPQSEALVGLQDYTQQSQQTVDLKNLIQQTQPSVGLTELIQQVQPTVGLTDLIHVRLNTGLQNSVQQTQSAVDLKELDQQSQVAIQSESEIGLKSHTPITEEVVDYANTQTKPNVNVENSQADTNSEKYINEQLKLARESKSVYGNDDDNLQYAAQYAFGYKIRDYHSGNDFGHEEVREGDVAKGHYHVMLPDGRLQNVDYWADPSGYHATVTYSLAGNHP